MLLETYTTGAIDYSKTNIKRHDISWNIKKQLVRNHVGRELLRKTFNVVKGLRDEEFADKLFDMFLGADDGKIPDTADGTPDVTHINSKTLAAMTDDQRLDLYNKIVASVLGDERTSTKKTIQ